MQEQNLLTASEYLKNKGFGCEQSNRLSKKTNTFSKVAYGNNYEPNTNAEGELVFEIKYLDQAFLSICNL